MLKDLSEEHPEVVAPSWPAIDDLQAKQALFKILIKNFHSVGLFSQEDPNTPIGWCMQYPTGQPAHLYVTEPYRRKGFATLIMKHICRCIREDGLIPEVSVEDRGVKDLMVKIGFVENGKCTTLIKI